MSGYIRQGNNLFDPVTKVLVGFIDPNGNEQVPGGQSVPVLRLPGMLLAEANPNVTVTDTVGSTATQMAVLTIPGGALGPRGRVLAFASFDVLGGTASTKNIILRAGPVSGNFATATPVSGQSGIPVGTRNHPTSALIWNDGTVGAQRATPLAAVNFTSAAGTLNTATMAIDTSVDWNIYAGCNFSAAEGGVGSVILRTFYVQFVG